MCSLPPRSRTKKSSKIPFSTTDMVATPVRESSLPSASWIVTIMLSRRVVNGNEKSPLSHVRNSLFPIDTLIDIVEEEEDGKSNKSNTET